MQTILTSVRAPAEGPTSARAIAWRVLSPRCLIRTDAAHLIAFVCGSGRHVFADVHHLIALPGKQRPPFEAEVADVFPVESEAAPVLPQVFAMLLGQPVKAGVALSPARGGMYAFFRLPGSGDSLETAKRLVREAGLGLAPGVAFGAADEGSVFVGGASAMAQAFDTVDTVRSVLERFTGSRPSAPDAAAASPAPPRSTANFARATPTGPMRSRCRRTRSSC